MNIYTLWISRCIATARERIPGSIDNDVTGVSECSQQRGNLKDDGYKIPTQAGWFTPVNSSYKVQTLKKVKGSVCA
ncbi:hypothetical protein [Photorhabdus bodei]|uniref:Uncharacterized protein n=1 Tax=Photorhabdus bodei TaxID=2029681 RepID=A0ABX0AWF6_9GAMM|nr:hypothetical protein [Photorhabdus bodei]NDL00961.1 hypothetical protein [Photorhabdus bodei]NDL05162.1 hypothetical protein [Photorhabdus bodei]NDL08483.1 hypothetical protein [Photorhabdus bodei]